ncbi:MAG: alcohol dehydrogenase catalytic domain-containing protein [Candidatus Limnocylindria bacterium]
MRAARLHAVGEPLRLEEAPAPQPRGSEVLLQVAGCGVCRTDLHIADGTQPRVELPVTLGHEVSGWVGAAGPEAEAHLREADLHLGDPVVLFGGWGCGACRECRSGSEQRCAEGRSPGFQADGGYAEAVLVPHPRHLVPLGDLDPVSAAPLADAGVTPYRAVQRSAPWLVDGARVLVIGAGALGQFALQYLRAMPGGQSLRTVILEAAERPATAALELGADAALVGADRDSIADALGGSADVVFDFVGSDGTLGLAAGLVRRNGLIMLIGEAGGQIGFGFERPGAEAWLTTTAWGSCDELRAVVTLAQTGRLRWKVERMPLADAREALDRLRNGSVDGRIVLVP